MEWLQGSVAEGFLKSWGMILVSEIGDKTFFIAAIMAMKNPQLLVFAGALAALTAMTILSAVMGWAAPNLISKVYTHYAAMALFAFFGLRLLWEAYSNTEKEGESELEEVERELSSKTSGGGGAARSPEGEPGRARPSPQRRPGVPASLSRVLPAIFVEAFVLTFLAEWGDRSQIATIGLAASTDVFGVTIGGIVGHALCTGAAVLGGRHLASHIEERTVSVIGGLLFLAFAAHSFFTGVPE